MEPLGDPDDLHYPEPADGPAAESAGRPTHAEIAARAHQLWLEEGQPQHCAERHWLQAERELQEAGNSDSLIERVHERAGSAQA